MLSSTRWTVLRAARAGDEDAMTSLVSKYRPAVVAYLDRRGLGSDSEDVAQEVLVNLVRTLPRVDSQAGRFRSLVFAIARNLLTKHQERANAAKRGGGRVHLVAEPDTYPSTIEPDDAFDREWLQNLVQACLRRLRSDHPAYFHSLRAFVFEGRPQTEIASELGVSVGTIQKRVLRGKRKIAAYLREEVWAYSLSPRNVEEELSYLMDLLGPLGEP